MRSSAIFNILALLPAIISAIPVSISFQSDSNADSDNSLADAALKTMAAFIDISRQFSDVAIGEIDSTSAAFNLMQGWRTAIHQQDAYQAFDSIISDIDCTYSQLSLLTPGDNPSFDINFVASIAWLSIVTNMTAESFVNNATDLGLNDTSVQMIQQVGETATALAMLTITSTAEPIDPADATLTPPLGNWEGAHVIKTFEPKCSQDPGVAVLDFPNIGTDIFSSPWAATLNMHPDVSDNCPNGRNDTNCFCQTIATNESTPLVSAAQRCPFAASNGMNLVYVTVGTDALSMDAGERANQAASGQIVHMLPPMFGPKP